jgi:hypothetical protein
MLQQLSIFVENEIGSLSKITTVLRENEINIRAFASFDSPEFSILRVIVDKTKKAKEILTIKGFVVKLTEVIAIELEDKPGDLDRVLHIIAKEGLCINYIYSFVIRNGKAPLMIMHLNDMDKGSRILEQNGIKLALAGGLTDDME